MSTIAVIGTFDTKGHEFAYLIHALQERGFQTLSIDLGTQQDPPFAPDIPAGQVAQAGNSTLDYVRNGCERAEALKIMADGAAAVVEDLFCHGQIHGIISLGGSQGTYMACRAMSVLPIGFPKFVVSTVAGHSGLGEIFNDINDTLVMNSVVDISGINTIFKLIIKEAVVALSQLTREADEKEAAGDSPKKKIGVSMWGVTTPCVNQIRGRLEEAGFEVYVFHANGMGGKMMERLVAEGQLQGVIDITMAELGNHLCGGYSPPTPDRIYAAARAGIPAIISVGGLDMISAPPPFDDLPKKFQGRKQYFHEENVLFVRSNQEENRLFGEEIAARLNTSEEKEKTKVILPLRGISANDKEGEVFFDPGADRALFSALKENLCSEIEVIEEDLHINDPEFANKVVDCMIKML